MFVPKTTVNQNNCIIFRKQKIGFAWQPTAVKSIPETSLEQTFPYENFRSSVFSTDPRHHTGASPLVDDISHGSINSWILSGNLVFYTHTIGRLLKK